jgi:hypothetical protein
MVRAECVFHFDNDMAAGFGEKKSDLGWLGTTFGRVDSSGSTAIPSGFSITSYLEP